MPSTEATSGRDEDGSGEPRGHPGVTMHAADDSAITRSSTEARLGVGCFSPEIKDI